MQVTNETLEFQEETKEESDEEEDDDEESGRLRFKTERKEGTIIRLSDVTRERRNIPETLGKILWQSLQKRTIVEGPKRLGGLKLYSLFNVFPKRRENKSLPLACFITSCSSVAV